MVGLLSISLAIAGSVWFHLLIVHGLGRRLENCLCVVVTLYVANSVVVAIKLCTSPCNGRGCWFWGEPSLQRL